MNITPLAKDLWEGIAGHFDSFTQVVCEFIDNSVSNFEANSVPTRTVHISVEELGKGKIFVQIEDTGSGIKEFEPVMKLGDRSKRETPLNEHGFGLKHALASANSKNDAWKVFSRTAEQFKSGGYSALSAPYAFDMSPESRLITSAPWPGLFNGPGTIISFECTSVFFNTIQKGIKGQAGFQKCLDYLREELGYIYSGVIEKGKANLTVSSKGCGYSKPVEAVKPDWVDFYKPGSGNTVLDLGGGKLTIEYQFGEMKESTYVKHYKRNMSTSGLEVRINGRLIVSQLFKDIWQIEKHPSYNHFLVIVNLVASNRDALPKTRTSKNGIRSGDEKLEHLFEWIRATHPTPPKDMAGAYSEKELVLELKTLKEKHIRNKTKHIETEFCVFKTLGSSVAVDLYVYDGTETVLYEAKKDQADVQNIYQLLMYWDGAVADGLKPDEGILVASSFADSVNPILAAINVMKDLNGNNYKLAKKTWHEEGVDYPTP